MMLSSAVPKPSPLRLRRACGRRREQVDRQRDGERGDEQADDGLAVVDENGGGDAIARGGRAVRGVDGTAACVYHMRDEAPAAEHRAADERPLDARLQNVGRSVLRHDRIGQTAMMSDVEDADGPRERVVRGGAERLARRTAATRAAPSDGQVRDEQRRDSMSTLLK